MNRRLIFLFLLLVLVYGTLPTPDSSSVHPQKKYDLVLIHGFNNRHQWGYEFLYRLAEHWGSGNVYVIYANPSKKVWTMYLHRNQVVLIGDNDHQAGNDSIDKQARLVSEKISILQKYHGLSNPFHIAAHSMGGLVAREVAYLRPGQVANIVTLATPHHGTQLANEYNWLGMFVHGEEALKDITPQAVSRFNRRFPVESSPFYGDGKLYTIAGDADGWGDRGWNGELAAGWTLIALKYHKDSDGVVEEGKATLPGAKHVKTFMELNHLELVESPHVADLVSRLLP
ncbi:alpha/beta hydrolase [Thermoactinomyces mirandus]|uniref:Alpha/beta hydrolase n=1 Tax=Thermoactinomyces mirandus TaxID=2756294 RepID=A0A7W1XTE4_9BACL|nr:alpha/beta hydrolase [Thermoactinomyces mirandus]MBA4602851.1 alpha/beta hydrolase [Thermoactinomyces mirandus]